MTAAFELPLRPGQRYECPPCYFIRRRADPHIWPKRQRDLGTVTGRCACGKVTAWITTERS